MDVSWHVAPGSARAVGAQGLYLTFFNGKHDSDIKLDKFKKGLLTLHRPYQAALIEHIWDINKKERTGLTSGQAHKFLKARAQVN